MPWGHRPEIAEQVIEQEADYLLTVKDNQRNLHEDMQLFFELSHQDNFQKVEHTYPRTVNKDHGRIEIRECWAISGEDSLRFLRGFAQWKNLTTIAMATSERQLKGRTTVETRYYISSLSRSKILIMVRQ